MKKKFNSLPSSPPQKKKPPFTYSQVIVFAGAHAMFGFSILFSTNSRDIS